MVYAKNSEYAQQVSIYTTDPKVDEVASITDKFSAIMGKININVAAGRSPDDLQFSGRRSSAMGTMSIIDALKAFTTETVLATKEEDGVDNGAIFDLVKDESVFYF